MNTRLAQWNANVERHELASDFIAAVRLLMRANGKLADALLYGREGRVTERVLKAVEGSANPGSGGWGGELASAASGFLQTLAPHGGIFDTAVQFAQPAPLMTRLALVAAYSVGDEHTSGELKRLQEFGIDQTELRERTCYGHFAVSSETVRLSTPAGNALLARAMRVALIAAVDTVLINEILSIATPVPSSGSPTADFSAVLETLDLRAGSKVLLIAHPTVVARLCMRETSGGSRLFPQLGLGGGPLCPDLTMLPSNQIDPAVIAAVDMAQLIMNAGSIRPSSSNEALLDLAAGDSGSPSPLSLWQANAVAAKLERHFGLSIPNTNSVGAINSVSYSNAVS